MVGKLLSLHFQVTDFYNFKVFPAAIMQVPVFSVDLPGYVSYGAFASVAGHELSHAFDNSGRHYDENGSESFPILFSASPTPSITDTKLGGVKYQAATMWFYL